MTLLSASACSLRLAIVVASLLLPASAAVSRCLPTETATIGPAVVAHTLLGPTYVEVGYSGLAAWDVSSQTEPVLVGATSAASSGIALCGAEPYVYVASGISICGGPVPCYVDTYLQVFDFSDPASPFLIAQTPGLGIGVAKSISSSGGALALGSTTGLHLVDITDPASPLLRASVPHGLTPAVEFFGGPLLAATTSSGELRVFDASNPAQPYLLGYASLSEPASDIVILGTSAYLASGAGGVLVFDLSHPTAPRFLSATPTRYPARGLAVSSALPRRIVVAEGSAGIQILKGPSSGPFVSIGAATTSGSAISPLIRKRSVLLLEESGSVEIFDLATCFSFP